MDQKVGGNHASPEWTQWDNRNCIIFQSQEKHTAVREREPRSKMINVGLLLGLLMKFACSVDYIADESYSHPREIHIKDPRSHH